MRLNKQHPASTIRMNITPMIDIVFLLLIFFITVSQVSEVKNEPVELPRLAGSEDQKPSVLTLNVREDGQLVIDGKAVSVDGMVSIVSQELQRVGDNPDRLTVVIRGDRRSKAGPINEATKALGRLQVKKVRFGVTVPQ